MSGAPHQGASRQDLAGRRKIPVILTEMHAIRPGRARDLDKVIHDKGHPHAAAKRCEKPGDFLDPGLLVVLGTQLQDVDPAGEP